MDKTVSNTGPFIHLAEIGEFELLKIFSKIYIPGEVYEEVCIQGMPGGSEVRTAENIEVLEISKEEVEAMSDIISFKLDGGELEALALCNRLGAKIFLTDDLDAREAGKRLGLEVHGSVGIIARAYGDGLINLDDAKKDLNDFYTVSKLFVTKADRRRGDKSIRDA